MATENSSAAAAAAKPAAGITGSTGAEAVAAATGGAGEVAPKQITTDQLARNLAAGREKKDDKVAISTNSRDNEGQLEDGEIAGDLETGKTAEELAAETAEKNKAGKAADGATDIKAGLQTLGLNAAQTAAIEKALAEGGGDLDAGALGLTEAQVTGLEKLFSEPAAAAAGAPGEEAVPELDLAQVPKLTKDQAKHVNGLFSARVGKVIATERGKAEAAVKLEREARTAAETKLAETQQQLARAKVAPVAASAQPLAEVTTAEQLQTATANARAVKGWAQTQLRHLARNPDAVAKQLTDAKIQLAEYTPEAMEDYLTEAMDRAEQTLTEHVPARQQYLQQEQQFSANVSKDFPWLDDPKDPRYAYTQGALQTFPEIKRVPHWKAVLAVLGMGMQAINEAQKAAAAKGKTPAIKIINRKPAKVTVRVGGSRAATTKAEADTSEAETEFKSTGSVKDLAKMFGSKRKAA